jgi:hypothetical protein
MDFTDEGTECRKSLFKLEFFLRRRWLRPGFIRMTFPFLVRRKRFAVPLWVFSLGIIASCSSKYHSYELRYESSLLASFTIGKHTKTGECPFIVTCGFDRSIPQAQRPANTIPEGHFAGESEYAAYSIGDNNITILRPSKIGLDSMVTTSDTSVATRSRSSWATSG